MLPAEGYSRQRDLYTVPCNIISPCPTNSFPAYPLSSLLKSTVTDNLPFPLIGYIYNLALDWKCDTSRLLQFGELQGCGG